MEPAASVTTRSFGVVGVAANSLRSPAVAGAAARFVGTVLKDFFWLQFSVRLKLRRIPVVAVDHPLDATVPFTPDRIGPYLDFVAFWIRPLGYIGRRRGRAAQQRYAAEFLELIEQCYAEAATVYRVRMSTTRRPRYLKGRFLAIHLFDPHYLCVPSLHIMIVVLAYSFYRRAFAELGLPPEETDVLDRELVAGAVEIAETVLYIKQHSVNCIPAALYAMGRITPEDVPAAEARAFIGQLFQGAPEVASGDAIRAHVQDVFDRLVAEGDRDPAWPATVQRFLDAF